MPRADPYTHIEIAFSGGVFLLHPERELYRLSLATTNRLDVGGSEKTVATNRPELQFLTSPMPAR